MKRVGLAIALACVLASSGSLLATSSSGVTLSNKVVSAAVAIQARTMANKLLLLEVGSDRAPVNIENVHQTFAPGGYSGWHTHPGPATVVVVRGELVDYSAAGCRTVFPAGSAILEAADTVHDGRNEGSEPVERLVT